MNLVCYLLIMNEISGRDLFTVQYIAFIRMTLQLQVSDDVCIHVAFYYQDTVTMETIDLFLISVEGFIAYPCGI